MSSTSEVGIAKNVAHLSTLITYCVSYGSNYNPSNAAIKLPGLNAVLSNAQTALTNAISSRTARAGAFNARMVAFKDIKKLSTRLLAALNGAGATTQQINNAKSIDRKIKGRRAKSIPHSAPAPASGTPTASQTEKATLPPPSTLPITPVTPPHPISVSQVSYDNLIQHMAEFIALLASIPSYNPNETDLKIASLNTYLANLNATNNAAIVAQTTLNNSLIARNKILYAYITGLCAIGEESKDYIKSVYGSTAAEYKQVRKLSFTKHRI